MEVAAQSRGESPSSDTGKHIIQMFLTIPFFQYLSCESALPLDDIDIVKGMYKDSISFLAEFKAGSHSVIKGSPDKLDIEPLPAMMPHVVYLDFGSSRRHEDRTLYLEFVATIGYPLGVVACTRGHHSSFALLLAHVAESSRRPAQLETSHHLQILSFEVNVRLVLFGQIG